MTPLKFVMIGGKKRQRFVKELKASNHPDYEYFNKLLLTLKLWL